MPASTSRPRFGAVRWLALALLIVAAGAAFWMLRKPSDSRPPIVMIVVDTLRADYLGTYGFVGPISPNIDRLAQESIVFDNAFSQAPWTKPSIASLFTSLYPEQHGVLQHGGEYGDPEAPKLHSDALPQRAVTMAEVLRSAGYETAAFVANPWIGRRLGFAQGFDVFDEEKVGNDVVAGDILDRARAWLANRDDARPYFLYLHFMDVHGPYKAPERDFRELLASRGIGARRMLRQEEVGRLRPYLLRIPWTLEPEAARLETWRARYAGGVRAFDREIGKFLEELRADGALDDAFVILTSDHGEELVDHGKWDHGYELYDEQMRVPLLMRRPGGRDGGRRVDALVNLIDLMPTLATVAGAPAPKGVAGVDLSPWLAGERTDDAAKAAIASGVKWSPEMRAIRTRSEKLIQDPRTGRTHLFDLEKDPREQNDLAEAAPERRRALEQALAAHLDAIARGPSFDPDRVVLDPAMRNRLEALGYVDEGAKTKPSSPGDAGHVTTGAKPETTQGEESP